MMWDKDPVSFIDDVVLKDGSQLIKDISTDMLNGLVAKMPIDTGRLIGNINVSLDNYDWSYNLNDFGTRGSTRAKGSSVIEGIGDKEMPSVFLTNSVYYMKYIEGGHSGFAPTGVFEPTFAAISMWYR